MLKILSSALLILLLFSPVNGQKTWSLTRCINYALENSLDMEQNELSVIEAEIDRKQTQLLRLPSLNGSVNYNIAFGRTVDPTTDVFSDQQFRNQGLSVSGGAVVFNGGRVNNTIRQAQLNKRATELDREQLRNDISLDVAGRYLTILFSLDNLENAQKNLALSRNQLEEIDKFIAAGSRPQNARLELVAQIAQNEQAIIAAQNEIDLSYLLLKHLLHLDPETQMIIERPELEVPLAYDIEVINVEDTYQKAMSLQPMIQAGEVRREYAELDVNLARSAMTPALFGGFSLGTNYSSASLRPGDLIGTNRVATPGVFINNESVQFEITQPVYEIKEVPYFNQIDENLRWGIGVNLDIPIFSQGSNKASVEKAKLNVIRTEVENQRVKDQLITDVQTAIADLKAAKKQYEASLRTLEALQAAYEDTNKRFQLGVASSFEFTNAQNNFEQAEIDVLIAKYDYIFRSKIVDYYQGIKITL
jgi:outer membrane protein